MTAEQKETKLERQRERRALMTPEQRNEYWATLTPEQKANKSEESRRWYASLTPEQKSERQARALARRTSKQRAAYALTQQKSAADRRRKFSLLKMGRPCYDCGNVFPPECMDWDHRPGTTKHFTISTVLGNAPFDSVVDEIAKCDLVCANCHRVRTQSRRN